MNKGAYNFGLMRINPNGTEDSSFGENARLLTAPNESDEKYAYAYKLLLQKDNKIVALGISSAGIGSYENFATAVRYTPNGTTSVHETTPNYQNEVTLYPNPTHSSLFIKNTSNYKLKSVRIQNLQGVLLQEIEPSINNSIDVSHLPSACYIISVLLDNGSEYHQTAMIIH